MSFLQARSANCLFLNFMSQLLSCPTDERLNIKDESQTKIVHQKKCYTIFRISHKNKKTCLFVQMMSYVYFRLFHLQTTRDVYFTQNKPEWIEDTKGWTLLL